MTISPATPSELDDALALLHGPAVRTERPPAPDAVLVARREGKIVGAVFGQKLPGGTGLICPARTLDNDPALEDALTAAATEHIGSVKVIEAFLSAAEMGRADALLRAGFAHVTRVWEMHRSPDSSPVPADRWSGRLALRRFPETDAVTFYRALTTCHEESLDCPEMQGVLSADEIVAGYRDCAADPSQWWLAELDAKPVGALILSGKELIFVGVLPERRGQRVGRGIVEAACRMSPELALIVDARNAPALQLYASLGFNVVGSREVFLKFPSASGVAASRKSSAPGH